MRDVKKLDEGVRNREVKDVKIDVEIVAVSSFAGPVCVCIRGKFYF